MTSQGHLDAFAAEVRRLAPSGTEPSLYPAFKDLLESAYGSGFFVDTQIGAPGAGFPDLTIRRAKRLVNWIEVKPPYVRVDPLPGPDAQRFDRYRRALPHIVLTNGATWILYEDATETKRVEVNPNWLNGTANLTSTEVSELAQFLTALLALGPVQATTYDYAVDLLATSARLIYDAVSGLTAAQLPQPLKNARNSLTDLLKTNPADTTSLSMDVFADTLAQLVTFGMVLSRLQAGTDIDPHTAPGALSTLEHKFVKSTLHAVTAADVQLEILLLGILRTTADAVNASATQLAGPSGSWDKVPYIYEDFFARYRPEDRFSHGIFYTPKEVTRFQVRRIAKILKSDFGLSGLNDPNVRYLDPACGTGTYLLALAEEAEREAHTQRLPVSTSLRELFKKRVAGFEVLPGPAVVAQARLTAWLNAKGATLGSRFPVYTVNSLTPPASASTATSTGNLWADTIGEEQAAGDKIKRDTPILVILGNPPWGDRPRETFETGQGANLVADWTRGASGAVINLYDLYVAFWRFACDLLIDRGQVQRPEGIVSFITNRSWIFGRAYGGMRKWLRDKDAVANIVDLGGDIRAGARSDDYPVFDVRAGSAISTLAFHGSKAHSVEYSRIMGTRSSKLSDLKNDTYPTAKTVANSGAEPFGPVDWAPIDDAPSLKRYFHARYPGIKTHRDHLVIALDGRTLSARLQSWNALPGEERRRDFHESSSRNVPATPYSVDASKICAHTYRPLDRRSLYLDRRFIDRPGTVSKVYEANPSTEAILSLDTRTTAGPAVIATDVVPGYNSFRGSYETHTFPIQPSPTPHAMTGDQEIHLAEQDLLSSEAQRWASQFGASARDVGAYLLALGNAPNYTHAFAEALAVDTARFPATADTALFQRAVSLGKQLLDAWCRRSGADGSWVKDRPGSPLGDVVSIEDGTATFEHGTELTGLHREIGEFEVSTYPVLRRYLEARSDVPFTVSLASDIRTTCRSIRAILELRQACDDVLADIIAGTLTAF